MLVYLPTSPGSRVHLRPDCRGLAPLRNGVQVVELKPWHKVCKRCGTRLNVLHHRCEKCHQARAYPCEHNGGVKVWIRRGDDIFPMAQFVWPENAAGRDLVQP